MLMLNGAIRETTKGNLHAAFPALLEPALHRLVRDNAQEIARSALDQIWSWKCRRRALRRVVTVDGLALLDESKQPTLLLSAHFAGFEVVMQRLAAEFSGAALYEPTGDLQFDAMFAAAIDRFHPQTRLPIDAGMRTAFRTLQQGVPLLLLPDMAISSRGALPVRFFGRLIGVSPLPGSLVQRTNARVLWLSMRRDGDRWRARMSCPSDLQQCEEPLAFAQALFTHLEKEICQNPIGYQWRHLPLAAATLVRGEVASQGPEQIAANTTKTAMEEASSVVNACSRSVRQRPTSIGRA